MAFSSEIHQWIVFAHVLGVLLFLLSHGAAASVGFRLRTERDHERLRALLDLSGASYKAFSIAFLWILATGILLGIDGEWWRQAWFWLALLLLFVITGVMTPLVAIPLHKVRRALGLKPPMAGKRALAAPPPALEEIPGLLEKAHPTAAAVVGFGGIGVILWLMMFKPF